MNTEIELLTRALDAYKHRDYCDANHNPQVRAEACLHLNKALSDLEEVRKAQAQSTHAADFAVAVEMDKADTDWFNQGFIDARAGITESPAEISGDSVLESIQRKCWESGHSWWIPELNTVTISRELVEKIYSTCKIRCDKEEWNMLEQLQQALGKEQG